MASFYAGRFATSLLVVIGVSLGVFLLTHLSGDPATLMLPAEAGAEEVAALRAKLGLGDPLPLQYGRFIARAARGDFGESLRHGRPALPLVLARFPATLQLASFSLLLAVLVAVPLGIACAARPRTWIDAAGRGVALLGQATPNFWLAILLITWLSVGLGWFPTSGRGGLAHVVLPAIAIAGRLIALLSRLVRSTMLEVLRDDYIRTARGKGLGEMAVLFRHALRNALIPVVTVIGLQFGYLLGGVVVIETVFTWPGVGLLTVQAIYNRDFPVVQAAVFVLAVGTVAVNLAVDLIYGLLDPRVRLSH